MNKVILVMIGLFSLLIVSCTSETKINEQPENEGEMVQKLEDVKEDSLRTVLKGANLEMLDSLLNTAKRAQWDSLSNEAMLSKTGQFFLGTPYVAHTLETEGEEQLVMNLCSLDCVTYVETVLALSKSIKGGNYTIADYHDYLKKMRYRKGVLGNYTSRLHYYSEWLKDNEELGLFSIISNELKVEKFHNQVNFMSTHPDSYKQLAADSTLVKEIQQIEEKISKQEMYYIPKDKIPAYEQHIKNGDIIMYATNIEGLDVSHLGLAHWKGDQLHFMHASTDHMKVVISEETIYDYLLRKEKNTGILVGRILL